MSCREFLLLFILGYSTQAATTDICSPVPDDDRSLKRTLYYHSLIATNGGSTLLLAGLKWEMRWGPRRVRTRLPPAMRSFNLLRTLLRVGYMPATVKQWSQCITKSQFIVNYQFLAVINWKVPSSHSMTISMGLWCFRILIWQNLEGWTGRR